MILLGAETEQASMAIVSYEITKFSELPQLKSTASGNARQDPYCVSFKPQNKTNLFCFLWGHCFHFVDTSVEVSESTICHYN